MQTTIHNIFTAATKLTKTAAIGGMLKGEQGLIELTGANGGLALLESLVSHIVARGGTQVAFLPISFCCGAVAAGPLFGGFFAFRDDETAAEFADSTRTSCVRDSLEAGGDGDGLESPTRAA